MSRQQKLAAKVLRHLVGLRRPHGSIEEGSVIPYLLRILGDSAEHAWVDGIGNLHIDTRSNHRHRTLFVAHIDTVHHKGGINLYREDAAGLHAVDAPLGADDAAGVSILAAMVGTVPGYYIFTRGEECGGIGAKYLADECIDILMQFDRAIAFDRKGTFDVITAQWCGDCCSAEFAEGLTAALNARGMLYMPTDKGVYTDTAEFIDCIPECTNIAVGYYGEHTDKEWLDLAHHAALLDAALTIPWDSLPTACDPDAVEEYVAPIQLGKRKRRKAPKGDPLDGLLGPQGAANADEWGTRQWADPDAGADDYPAPQVGLDEYLDHMKSLGFQVDE